MALQNYTHAIKCYQEQLERAQDLQDSSIEAEAFGMPFYLTHSLLNARFCFDAMNLIEII